MQAGYLQAWHAFRSEIKCELRAQTGLRDLGFETFIPVEKRIVVRCRRKHIVESPLFPRYGFVKFDINRDNWGQIRNTDGVEDLLSNNQLPVRVPENQISQLQLAEKFGLFDRTKKPAPFKEGDSVEIGEGPFAGFLGKVMKARTDERINVLLDFFGSARAIDFPLLHIRENQI